MSRRACFSSQLVFRATRRNLQILHKLGQGLSGSTKTGSVDSSKNMLDGLAVKAWLRPACYHKVLSWAIELRHRKPHQARQNFGKTHAMP